MLRSKLHYQKGLIQFLLSYNDLRGLAEDGVQGLRARLRARRLACIANSSHIMYYLNSFRKSTRPLNRYGRVESSGFRVSVVGFRVRV